ncbi:unnamed protein product [Rotaria sp. Silwood1]|nr:unnamed protein product [Rotaria sp. Silwood1]CAF4733163.1 unnamed protein product [Rotaria sp. Silwood1]
MRDIHRELTNNQCQSLVKVYRGQLIASDEIDILKNSIGDLISMKSFLSTSLDRQKAAFYIEGASLTPSNQSDSSLIPVLFEIVDDSSMNESKGRPFANITQFREFSNEEEEILFMAGSIYLLLAVCEENNIYIVSLQLSGNIEDDMQILMDHLKAERAIAVDSGISLVTFVDILHDMDKIDLVEKFAKRALHDISIAANSGPMNVIDIAKCHFYLGYIAENHDRFDVGFEEFNTALNYVLLMKEPDSKTVATIYAAIGNCFQEQKQYKRALHYYTSKIVHKYGSLVSNEKEL